MVLPLRQLRRWTVRSHLKEDRNTLRTVFRYTPEGRASATPRLQSSASPRATVGALQVEPARVEVADEVHDRQLLGQNRSGAAVKQRIAGNMVLLADCGAL
jgi:hypothetical protein